MSLILQLTYNPQIKVSCPERQLNWLLLLVNTEGLVCTTAYIYYQRPLKIVTLEKQLKQQVTVQGIVKCISLILHWDVADILHCTSAHAPPFCKDPGNYSVVIF